VGGSGRRIAAAAAILATLGVSAAGAAGPGDSLQAQAGTLQARARHALLDLYALDSRLHRAQRRLSALEGRAASLQREQALLTRELTLTRETLTTSRQLLETNLRVLYKQDDVSPLAIVLGAQSLDDAVTKLDDLSRITDQSRRIVAVTRSAQTRVVGLRRALHRQRVQIDADVAAALQTTQTLAAARSNRLAFIADLRRKARLKSQQIEVLQQVAQQVEQRSDSIQSTATTQPAIPPAPPPGGATLTVSSTGYSLPGHTATGMPVGFGVVAVDPSVIPLGTRLTIPGYGEAVAADTGTGVRGADIDLWFPTLAQARAWGRRTVTITLH
jgi:3D (Asp-Asp-Asp) domain-containing protein